VKREVTEKNLVLLEADKEAKFVILPKDQFEHLQNEALEKSFEKLTRNTTKLEELKGEIEKILKSMEKSESTYSWMNRVKSTKEKYLSTFAKYKSHKKKGGLRMIVNESDTFQGQTSLFLKSGLSKLDCRDPFKVNNSEELIKKLEKIRGKGKKSVLPRCRKYVPSFKCTIHAGGGTRTNC
jgi:PHD/YefM family antitoxin component YafN of YafNO toxin-antitoxin module